MNGSPSNACPPRELPETETRFTADSDAMGGVDGRFGSIAIWGF